MHDPDDQAPTAQRVRATVDGNEAAASVAHRLSEILAIYPITPSSPMGELADEWSSAGCTNVWGDVPDVVEMQSEGGAAGAAARGTPGGGPGNARSPPRRDCCS